MKQRHLVFLLLLAVLTSVFGNPVKKGKISGSVFDKETKKPLVGANVILVGSNLGAATSPDGKFTILNIPFGIYDIETTYMGYYKYIQRNLVVNTEMEIVIPPIYMSADTSNKKETVTVVAQRDILHKEVSNSQLIVSEIVDLSGRMPAVKSSYYMGQQSQKFNTEEYERIHEIGFLETLKNPLSTFSVDVDAASYANARRFIENDEMPVKDAVRIEEFINYFDYDYKLPKGKDPFSVFLEYSECPWQSDHNLVHIGLKGKMLGESERSASNLVFLLDVSGSMTDNNKLPLLKKAFTLLVNELQDKDRVAIVVYAGSSGQVLESTLGSEKEKIKEALSRLEAGGSTAGAAGIQLAYKVAKENFIRGGNNRIILATDGDFNVGVSSTSELERMIEEKRKEGIFLTVLGFGMNNYKDHRMETLADKGNGNYFYIDNLMEGKKVFVNDLQATLFTIAKDVKLQVEFNPAKVKEYRLIGYENRMLRDEDFEDDTKDAGEIGAGHTVTALYEVVPGSSEAENQKNDDLKYSRIDLKPSAQKSDDLLTLKIRYKDPDGDESKLLEFVLKDDPVKPDHSSDNFKFSAAVAEFAMLLRESEFKGDANYDHVLKLAKNSIGKDDFGYRHEFIQLVERIKLIQDIED